MALSEFFGHRRLAKLGKGPGCQLPDPFLGNDSATSAYRQAGPR
jgi:hypothetical protein